MKNLVILTGLSCTLKDSVSNYLVQNGNFIKFPDVNRNYIKTLTSIATQPELLDVTSKIPNIMLCANRLGIYNAFLDGIESSECNTENFVIQRTVVEHLFFDNGNIITLVDKNKLIEEELKFLSRFDSVKLVLIENKNREMLEKYYLTDKIRTSITKDDDQLAAYFRLQAPYKRFIEQLKPLNMQFTIKDDQSIVSEDLTQLTIEIAETIIQSI